MITREILKCKGGEIKMKNKLKGNSKECGRIETTKYGYQELWDTGRAHNKKMKNKISGVNRPGV